MIQKLLSAGLSSADLAALDAAISIGVQHGGWTPGADQRDVDGLPSRYMLVEMPTDDRAACIERNVIESGGVLLFYLTKPSENLSWAKRTALINRKQFLGIDPGMTGPREAAELIHSWISMHHLSVVFFIGPETNSDLDVRLYTYQAMESALMRVRLSAGSGGTDRKAALSAVRKERITPPRSVEEAVDRLVGELPLKEKARLANTDEENVADFNISLGKYIRHAFHLRTGNPELMESCRALTDKTSLSEKEVSAVIVAKLFLRLQKTHRLRRVK